jgi:integrase
VQPFFPVAYRNQAMLATALEQAEIEGVTWHTLRHTFASRLVMAGVDLKTLQELMGHKTIAMTARYAHLAPTHKLQVLETLVRPGSVSVQSGYKLATNAKKATRTSKLNSLQFIESK